MIADLVKILSETHPISSALASNGPFSTSYKRREFMKEHFSVVEPIQYILNEKECKTFQYLPILQSLSQVLNNKSDEEKLLDTDRNSVTAFKYQSFHDGSNFQINVFFSEEDRLSLILYIADFEVCNPLGTSRKRHKVTALYWILGNIPAQSQSALTCFNLAVLCKAADTKTFGYQKEPLLTDLRTSRLQPRDGLFVPGMGKVVKGTVMCVVQTRSSLSCGLC